MTEQVTCRGEVEEAGWSGGKGVSRTAVQYLTRKNKPSTLAVWGSHCKGYFYPFACLTFKINDHYNTQDAMENVIISCLAEHYMNKKNKLVIL